MPWKWLEKYLLYALGTKKPSNWTKNAIIGYFVYGYAEVILIGTHSYLNLVVGKVISKIIGLLLDEQFPEFWHLVRDKNQLIFLTPVSIKKMLMYSFDFSFGAFGW